MRWRSIVFMTVVLVFSLSGPAASQEWVDIKDPKELRALHSNKTFKGTFEGRPFVQHFRADGKGINISGEQRMSLTWEVKGDDQVCVSSESGTNCFRFQHSKKNPDEYVKRHVSQPWFLMIKVEDGIPQF